MQPLNALVFDKKDSKVLIRRLKQESIRQAIKKHGMIYPCGNRRGLDECFTLIDDTLYFWYNCADNRTHVVKSDASGMYAR
ncbi:MAG: hypothetical protein GF398_08795 [Chitinivibrionales bacterium]|nr:hypothetical protein [Chitinivibrionales bacterium]